MRNLLLLVLSGWVACLPVHARDGAIKFEGVQEKCVQGAGIKFGAGTPWPDCTVIKGRWFATLDFQDMYQAQYCLGQGDGVCAQRAQLVFSNRAYTPLAKVMLKRLDPGQAEYEDPQLVQTKYGNVLTLSANLPDGSASRRYYRWQSGQWVALEARGWLRELARQLPKGETVAPGAWPDADSMAARAQLHNAAAASDKFVDVKLRLVNDRFTVDKVLLVQASAQ